MCRLGNSGVNTSNSEPATNSTPLTISQYLSPAMVLFCGGAFVLWRFRLQYVCSWHCSRQSVYVACLHKSSIQASHTRRAHEQQGSNSQSASQITPPGCLLRCHSRPIAATPSVGAFLWACVSDRVERYRERWMVFVQALTMLLKHTSCVFFQLYCTVQRSRVRMCATVSEPKQLGDREFNDDVIHRQILEPLHRQWITGQLTMTAANPRLDSDWLIANKTHLGGNVPNKQLCQSLTPKLWDRKGLNFIIRERRDTIFVEINANTFFFCYQICIIIWTTEMCEKSNQTKYSSISVSIIWQSDKRHTYEVTLIHSNECNWIHMPRHTHKKNHLYTVSSQPTLK